MGMVDQIGFALIAGAFLAFGAVADERFDPDGAAYKTMRTAAFARAGIPLSSQCHRGHPSHDCMILDHIRPLCLKGENALENLQVQPCSEWTGHRCVAGDAFEKDIDEDAACAAVRAGRTTAEAAAARFEREWP